MPPAGVAHAAECFSPDYPLFLLCDRVIVDSQTYDRLLHNRHWSYEDVANTLKALEADGFLRLEDFESVIDDNRELLAAMLERDLKELEQWVPVLKESTASWQEFVDSLANPLSAQMANRSTHGTNLRYSHDTEMVFRLLGEMLE